MKLRSLLNEAIKVSALKTLSVGDKIWVQPSKKMEAVQVDFIEFILGSGSVRDTIKAKTDNSRLNPDSSGIIRYPVSVYYLEDPEFEVTGKKKGFLSRGIQGPRKWK